MLFHVTHVHTPETCPGDDLEKTRATFGKLIAIADEIGIKIIGAYANASAHTTYLIIEADTNTQITEFFRPTLTMASVYVRPVEDAFIVAKRFMSTT